MKDVPVFDSHQKTLQSLLGKVLREYRDNFLVRYEATIDDDKVKDLIKRKVVQKVSVGLSYESEYEEFIDNVTYLGLKGITVRELSLTLFPSVDETSIEYSLDFVETKETIQDDFNNEDINALIIEML